MLSGKVDKVRGMNDIFSNDIVIQSQIEAKLCSCFESFGYEPINVPIIEQTELYLRKSGEDITRRLYDFTYQNRRLCLRPEMTASIVRAYIDNLQGRTLPVRVYYSGPVFRYERPQKGRNRQFTQIGIELIGGTGSVADAEIIALACKGLDLLRINDYRVSIGHVGILAEFLAGLNLEPRVQSLLLSNIETIREKGAKVAIDLLMSTLSLSANGGSHSLDEVKLEDALTEDGPNSGKLADIILGLNQDDAKMVIRDLLRSMDIQLDNSRPTEEIVSRLLGKIQRRSYEPQQIIRAVKFLDELSQLNGSLSNVFKEAEKLLAAYDLGLSPLNQLQLISNLMKYYDLDISKIQMDLGLSRGLQYYTGMIFEIYHNNSDDSSQLCGGGRYDDLIVTLGGRKSIPGLGFSYGLERLQLALEDTHIPVQIKNVDVLVVSVSEDDYSHSIKIAEALRRDGLVVEMDVRNRSVTSNFQYANRQDITFVCVIGSDERSANSLYLKNMKSGEETRLNIGDATKYIREKTNNE